MTRNGVPVDGPRPLHRGRQMSAEAVIAAFAGAPAIDSARFRADLDAAVDQNPAPGG